MEPALAILQKKQQDLTQEYFNLGLTYAQQGKLQDSEIAFRSAIALNPNYADAYANLGVILKALKKSSLNEIEEIFRKSIALQPDNPDLYYNLGTILIEQGKTTEAIATFKKGIELRPEYPQAYYNLALAYKEQGNIEEVIANLSQAIKLNPNYALAHFNLAILYMESKELELAKNAFSELIKINPNHPEAHNYLGAILTEQNHPDLNLIANHFKKAIKLNPNYSEAYYNLGVILNDQNNLNEAEKAFKIAIKLKPDYYQAYNNLGAILKEKDDLQTAAKACSQALKIKPDYYQSYYNLSLIYKEQLLLDKAEKAIVEALKLNDDYPKGHFSYAYLLLLRGNFSKGLPEYEWRWKSHQLTLPKFTQPLWMGSDLTGKTILLVSEQGYGDTLQFIRYALALKDKGATVKLACQEKLVGLLKNIPALTEVVSIQKPIKTDFDYYCPLMSLPLAFNTTLNTIPAPIPYITCERSLPLISPPDTRIKIGIVWASGLRGTKSDSYYTYKKKSSSLKDFTKLLSIPGITLYSLQVGEDASQIDAYSDNSRIVNLSPTIKDFTDTAAIINQLDLVISVDTSVAHLVGAMGKPVWLLLPFSPEWRWLLDRNDTPWYPTMRLFRQKQPGNWQAVFDQVIKSISETQKPDMSS